MTDLQNQRFIGKPTKKRSERPRSHQRSRPCLGQFERRNWVPPTTINVLDAKTNRVTYEVAMTGAQFDPLHEHCQSNCEMAPNRFKGSGGEMLAATASVRASAKRSLNAPAVRRRRGNRGTTCCVRWHEIGARGETRHPRRRALNGAAPIALMTFATTPRECQQALHLCTACR